MFKDKQRGAGPTLNACQLRRSSPSTSAGTRCITRWPTPTTGTCRAGSAQFDGSSCSPTCPLWGEAWSQRTSPPALEYAGERAIGRLAALVAAAPPALQSGLSPAGWGSARLEFSGRAHPSASQSEAGEMPQAEGGLRCAPQRGAPLCPSGTSPPAPRGERKSGLVGVSTLPGRRVSVRGPGPSGLVAERDFDQRGTVDPLLDAVLGDELLELGGVEEHGSLGRGVCDGCGRGGEVGLGGLLDVERDRGLTSTFAYQERGPGRPVM